MKSDALSLSVMMTQQPTEPKTKTDWRVAFWFFSWLGGLFLCSTGFVLSVWAIPAVSELVEAHVWLIVVAGAGGFLCVAVATTPWYLGIRCPCCRRKLRPMAADCDLKTGNKPIRFHCENCQIIW